MFLFASISLGYIIGVLDYIQGSVTLITNEDGQPSSAEKAMKR